MTQDPLVLALELEMLRMRQAGFRYHDIAKAFGTTAGEARSRADRAYHREMLRSEQFCDKSWFEWILSRWKGNPPPWGRNKADP